MRIGISGGAGYLGKEVVSRLYNDTDEIIVMSRNESQLVLLKEKYPKIKFISGSICDPFLCKQFLDGVDTLYHFASIKHVGISEKQPNEAVKTNVIGTMNLLEHFKGSTFLFVSTDKAVRLSGVYGTTKFLAEKIIQEYAEINPDVKYRIVRYGNILYSSGSVLEKWRDSLINKREIIVTDLSATRYFWTVDQAVDLIFECLEKATSPEPYCPQMKSVLMADLLDCMIAKYGNPVSIKTIGLQPGENKHEQITADGLPSNKAKMYSYKEIFSMV